jgi:glutamate dehydrogenase/leucine dehydrogenase
MSVFQGKQIFLTTPRGNVRIRSFCSPEEIRTYTFDDEFGSHAQFKSLYTRRESLETDAAKSDANVVLALNDHDHIVAFAVLTYPDKGERWLELGPGLMIELRVIEVCRRWRSGKLAYQLLQMAMDHPAIEEKIAYMIGYAWTWDLDGTERRAQEYRQILIHLFESQGFEEYETNEPNICLRQENLFMCRVGSRVPDDVVDRFGWLRFGIAPEPQAISFTGAPSGRSLFVPLREEGLTFLGIYYDWKKYCLSLRAGGEWDPAVDWETYNRNFSSEHPLTTDTRYLGHEKTLALFEKYGLRGYLDDIVDQLKKGRHQGIECFYEPRRDIQLINHMHSNALARGQIYHALRSGGICLYGSDHDEISMIGDGLRMSRATTFKNASAQLPFGGGRISVRTRSLEIADHASMGFIAYALDRSRCVVGPDMGFPAEIADVIRREGYSPNIVGGFDSKIGSPSIPTAYGVLLALKEATYSKFGTLSLAGKKIVVQGVGAVGSALVEKYLVSENAHVYIADIAPDPVEKLAARFPGRVTAIDPDQVYGFDGDILIPCAKGGILNGDTIALVNYAIILGAANNALRAEDQDEEIRLARLLDRKNILYQVDWMHNNAGVIAVAEAYLHRRNASLERVMAQVESVCRNGVRDNLRLAKANGVTPTEQAYAHYDAMIYA